MERSRRATLRFLSRIPDGELLRTRTQGRWSIKDVLAHIAAWEEEGARRLQLIAQGHGHRIHFYNDPRDIDRFNASAVAATHQMSLRLLFRRLTRARDHLTGALNRLPPRALRDLSYEFPVVVWLPEFAWTHEQGHLREMRRWWRKTRSDASGPKAIKLRRRRRRGPTSRGSSDPRPRGHRDPEISP
jgi:DinB superfamily